MTRLVVVSNRLPSLERGGHVGEPEVPVGGLASALVSALKQRPGSVWFGWNGRVIAPAERRRRTRRRASDFDLVGLPLTADELSGYYLGHCNETLWPLFHSMPGEVRLDERAQARYASVQSRFARAILPTLAPDDLVWVHDYHLLPLARELRRGGFGGRIGFFLHTPWPPFEMWQMLPQPADLLASMLDYDLVGFHVLGFLDNYVYACRRLFGASWDGFHLRIGERVQRAAAYPVGIDPGVFAASAGPRTSEVKRALLGDDASAASIVLGVDRLDYTKGIPLRIRAFEEFLRRAPAWRKKVIYVQVAAPSRTELPGYRKLKGDVEALAGRVNGELGEHDWTPVRYLYRSYGRDFLARLYAEADVGLVTPLRDGMNLVAEEYVAAQHEADPGVLLLSRLAGAAQILKGALTVNPYAIGEVADAIGRALEMPLAERLALHERLLPVVRSRTADAW
ncbi:MAG TPA: trehalose-6-phosphate synthase, partial [Gemmatimonadales bacterium]